jgi:hypothetical protein
VCHLLLGSLGFFGDQCTSVVKEVFFGLMGMIQ